MIQEHIKAEIFRRIKQAEEEHNVEVIYAVESGSRAWGFESPNSDYDVRFIYKHPKDWYLGIDIEDKRDVIEYEIVDDIDINGWDIRKALRLFAKSNPGFVEWLQSPIVYIDNNVFSTKARNLLPDIYSIEKGIHHYHSMAKKNYRGYLRTEIVPIKKYFYVLRPLLAIKWLEKYRTHAPIEFNRLRMLIKDNKTLDTEIEKLLAIKKQSQEKSMGKAIPALNAFIENELNRLEQLEYNPALNSQNIALLNNLFKSIIA